MPSSHILQFLGGLAFFFFGLYTIHQGLHSFAGDRLKNMVARTTQGPIRSFLTGVVVTFFLSSSSAVNVMTVGLASSGLLTLEAAIAVSLGAGVGTTFLVLLISVKSIVEYGLLLIILGLVLRFLGNRKAVRIAGEILFGFGFVFLGLTVMSQATAPLQSHPWIPEVFRFMEQNPFVNFIIAAAITAVVQSSAVVLGILISLAYAGSITFPVALPLVLGANAGTAFTAILATVKAKTEGKRTAWVNLVIRTGAALLVFPFLALFIKINEILFSFVLTTVLREPITVQAEISLCHLFFNIVVALVFLPLIPIFRRVICFIIPQKKGELEVFGPKYLDKSALSTPSLAFAQVNREMVRMGEIVQGMFRDSLPIFKKYNMDKVDEIESRDHKVDALYRAVKFYLAKLSIGSLTEEEANTGICLMTAVDEIENIGDTISRHVLRLAHKKRNKGIEFSEEGWKEICETHCETTSMIEMALAAMGSGSREVARKLQSHQADYVEREDKLKLSHLMRLHEGRKESIDTSAIHLELLSLFHRIQLSLLTMVSYLLTEEEGE